MSMTFRTVLPTMALCGCLLAPLMALATSTPPGMAPVPRPPSPSQVPMPSGVPQPSLAPVPQPSTAPMPGNIPTQEIRVSADAAAVDATPAKPQLTLADVRDKLAVTQDALWQYNEQIRQIELLRQFNSVGVTSAR